MNRIRPALPLLLALLLLPACGGDDAPTDPGTPPPAALLPPDPDGMPLPGADDDPAVAATVGLAPSPAAAADRDGTLLTTRLMAIIAPQATVGQVNAALADQQAAIVSMMAGDPCVVLVVAAAADLAAAQARAADLVATGAFIHARPGFQPPPAVVPSPAKVLPDPIADGWLGHLLPSRLPAAWNLRDEVTSLDAALIVPGCYAYLSGVPELPRLRFGAGGSYVDPAAAGVGQGYDLLAVAAADWSFDEDAKPLTGADPVAAERLDLKGVPIDGLDWAEVLAAAAQNLTGGTRDVLLSDDTFESWPESYLPRYDRAWLALRWRTLLAARGTAPDFVHVVSAGRSDGGAPAPESARRNSPYALAALADLPAYLADAPQQQRDDFAAVYAAEVARMPSVAMPVTNVLVVGSSDAQGTASAFSAPDADVRAVGEGVAVPCLTPADCPDPARFRSGTGLAAAQVAGLACYLWHLEPFLSADDLLLRLQHAYAATSVPGILDAWIAVLSLDRGGSRQHRLELLDVSGPGGAPDGVFTEHDLRAFAAAFDAYGSSPLPDWTRYDLNGDGWTGGDRVARTDLSADDLPSFGGAAQTVAGQTMTFAEDAATDQDVLCYYAWSDLFTGDPVVRATELACGGGVGPVLTGSNGWAGAGVDANATDCWDRQPDEICGDLDDCQDERVQDYFELPAQGSLVVVRECAASSSIKRAHAEGTSNLLLTLTTVRDGQGDLRQIVVAWDATAASLAEASDRSAPDHWSNAARAENWFEMVVGVELFRTSTITVDGQIEGESWLRFESLPENHSWEVGWEEPPLTLDESVAAPPGRMAVRMHLSTSQVANGDIPQPSPHHHAYSFAISFD